MCIYSIGIAHYFLKTTRTVSFLTLDQIIESNITTEKTPIDS